jgi:hypothetical protein
VIEYTQEEAAAMHTTLTRVAGWLWTDLIHPDKPLDKTSAGKALAEINGLINPIVERSTTR